MKKLAFIIILVIISTFDSCAQDTQKKTIYFISAKPGKFPSSFKNEKEKFSKNLLLKIDIGDSLKIMDTLSIESNTITSSVKYYYKKNKIFICENKLSKTDSSVITIVDFIDIPHSKNFFTNLNISYHTTHLVNELNEDLFVFSSDLKNDDIYYAVDNELKIRKVKSNIFRNTFISGNSGPAVEGSDFLIVYYLKGGSNYHLSIPVTKKIKDRPIFPIQVPLKHEEDGKRNAILINNDELFVIRTKYSDYNNNIGRSSLLLLNKNKNKWVTLSINGNQTNIRNFGHWLVGFVSGHLLTFKESPGKNYRKIGNKESGVYFDERANLAESYFPGVLYLYNINKQKYIEWEALENGRPQGDSEILLVENEIVYYRINDKIYQRKIKGRKKIGKRKLLVQDDKVRDIHWAFISK